MSSTTCIQELLKWTCKCPNHVEAIYENKIIVKLFASSWYISLLIFLSICLANMGWLFYIDIITHTYIRSRIITEI